MRTCENDAEMTAAETRNGRPCTHNTQRRALLDCPVSVIGKIFFAHGVGVPRALTVHIIQY